MDPERGVAVLHGVDGDADGHEVEDLVELAALLDHLLVDAPEVLAPAGHVGVDAQLAETAPDLGDDPGEVDVALGRAGAHQVVELGVALRVQRGEAEILELLLHLLHPQAVGQGGVDVEGLLRDAPLLLGAQRGQRAHVVEPVGQLDDQDPEVLGHGHQHLAHGGGLLLLLGVEAQPVELGHPVDDGGQVAAEGLLEVGQLDVGVLDRVVQQRGGDGGVVETDVGHDAGHRQGWLM